MTGKYDDKIAGAVLLTVVGVAILAFGISSFVKFKPQLTNEENVLVNFSPNVPPLNVRKFRDAAGIACPVTAAAKVAAPAPAVAFPPGAPPLLASTPTVSVAPKEPHLSLILFEDGRRMAIIDGKVVREGERFNKATVARIEKERILLREGKGEQWLKLK